MEQMPEITEEKIREYIKQFQEETFEKTGIDHSKDGIFHHEWEENGERYSSWEIRCGNTVINTGDEGIRLYEEALKNQFK